MKICPKCKKRTLRTAEEELRRANADIHSIGEYFGRQPWYIADFWSCCSEKCTSCSYIK